MNQQSSHDGNCGNPRFVVGWREWIGLPEWGIKRLRAKTDTGARSSALDVTDIEELPGNRVRFLVRLCRRRPERTRAVEADIVRRTRVRSSNGQTHDRIVVRTPVQIGPVLADVEFTLVWRSAMLCRALLGRWALADQFIVDPSRRYVLTPRIRPPRVSLKQQGALS